MNNNDYMTRKNKEVKISEQTYLNLNSTDTP